MKRLIFLTLLLAGPAQAYTVDLVNATIGGIRAEQIVRGTTILPGGPPPFVPVPYPNVQK
jgi:hypothetical protein